MIKPIVTSKRELSVASVDATKDDLFLMQDLKDTLRVTQDCIGMAANMIGSKKKVLIAMIGNKPVCMANPVILKKVGQYIAYEGCASYKGEEPRKTIRYKKIKVEYLNENFEKRIKTFTDLDAEVIQHQIDHFNGVII